MFYKNSTFFPTLQLGDMPLSDSDQEDEQQDEHEMLNDQMKIEILLKIKEHREKEGNRQPFFHDGISVCTIMIINYRCYKFTSIMPIEKTKIQTTVVQN